MLFSSNFGAAIHTLLIINEESKNQKVTSDTIAKMAGTNPVLIRRLLAMLKKAGFVSIAPRKEKDGTKMNKPLSEITLYDVFQAVEPNHLKVLIKSSTRLANCSHAGIYVNEIITEYVEIAVNAVKMEFNNITLADTLESLVIREIECSHDNPRAVFANNKNSEKNEI